VNAVADTSQGLSDATTSLRDDVERAERGEEEMRMLQQALEERENVLLQLQAMEGQGELMEHKLQEIEAQKRDLNEQIAELKQTKLIEIPLIKHALSLYVSVTRMRWDYRATDSYKGFVGLKDDIRKFEIVEKDPVRAADQLWAMMDVN
jgi:hypothetical protein